MKGFTPILYYYAKSFVLAGGRLAPPDGAAVEPLQPRSSKLYRGTRGISFPPRLFRLLRSRSQGVDDLPKCGPLTHAARAVGGILQTHGDAVFAAWSITECRVCRAKCISKALYSEIDVSRVVFLKLYITFTFSSRQ